MKGGSGGGEVWKRYSKERLGEYAKAIAAKLNKLPQGHPDRARLKALLSKVLAWSLK